MYATIEKLLEALFFVWSTTGAASLCNIAAARKMFCGVRAKAVSEEPEPATLFLEDINMGTWPSRLMESRTWDSKIWS
jgi:hypothetical protein